SFSGTLSASFSANNLRLSGNNVSVAVDGFGSLSGAFSVEKDSSSDPRLLVGLGNVQADFGGVTISGGSLGLYIARNALGESGYALVANGTGGVSGLADLSLSATAAVRVNTLGEAVSRSITVGGASLAIEFASGNAVKELLISDGTVSISALGGQLRGAMGIRSETVTTGGITTSTLRIGLSGVSGQLTPGGVGATLSGASGAILIEKITPSGGTASSRYALQVGGNLALSGISGVTLDAQELSIAYNRLGRALENEVVATGSGDYAMNLLDNETRVRGRMNVEVAGALSVSGDMFIESRSDANAATVTLTDGNSVSVNQLIFGGAGISGSLGNSTVGASLRDLDIAVVLSTERGAGTRRWISAQALLGAATVQGYALADIRSARLLLNTELVNGALELSGTRSVSDWNGPADSASTAIAISPDQSLSFAQGQRTFKLDVDGAMAFGPASMSGQFNIELDQSAQGDRAWHIRATNVSVGLQANGARVGLSNGTGDLWLGKNDASGAYGAAQRSGVITGTASVTGVSDLTLTGTFATRFDSQGNLELAGAADIAIAGFASINGQFAVTQNALQTAQPASQTATQTAGVTASITETQQGGVRSSSSFRLAVAEGSGSSLRVREGSYSLAYGSASAQVRLLAADQDAVWLQKLQAAAQSLFGFGNAVVTGTKEGGFAITLAGTLSGQAIQGLSVTLPADPSQRSDWGSNYLIAQATTASGAVHALDLMPVGTEGTITYGFDFQARSDTRLTLGAYDSASGRFREGVYAFSFAGTTVSVGSLSASGGALADAVLRERLGGAFEQLFGAGNVLVSGSRSAGFELRFTGSWAGQSVAVDSAAGGTGLFMRAPTDPAAAVAASDRSEVIQQAQSGSIPSAYTLRIQVPASGATTNSDSFALSFANSPKSASVIFVNLQDSQGRHLIDALMALTGSTATYSTR
ncbi:MAG: hypothetical protein ACKODB_14535, partial [Betaproteobacteria bacterium]